MSTWKHRKAHRQKIKLEVMQRYGAKCACCGEDELVFLAIDHIEGGGTQHRETFKIKGDSFYYWLRRNDYPDGFQVLCHNCNFAKIMGECPHKKRLGVGQ